MDSEEPSRRAGGGVGSLSPAAAQGPALLPGLLGGRMDEPQAAAGFAGRPQSLGFLRPHVTERGRGLIGVCLGLTVPPSTAAQTSGHGR